MRQSHVPPAVKFLIAFRSKAAYPRSCPASLLSSRAGSPGCEFSRPQREHRKYAPGCALRRRNDRILDAGPARRTRTALILRAQRLCYAPTNGGHDCGLSPRWTRVRTMSLEELLSTIRPAWSTANRGLIRPTFRWRRLPMAVLRAWMTPPAPGSALATPRLVRRPLGRCRESQDRPGTESFRAPGRVGEVWALASWTPLLRMDVVVDGESARRAPAGYRSDNANA
jgi:hypothetical protein